MAIRTLGSRYLLDEQIGQGGMGVVWRGRDKVTGSPFAIKLLRSEYATDPDAVTRFVRERTVLMKFRHPAVVTVHDMIVEGDQLALVMDLVEGGDLNAYRQRSGGTLTTADAARLAALICDGLAAAHAAGIVHRDLKPANVLLDAGQVKLADFGVARIVGDPSATTTTGTVLGTAAYLAPELLSGSEPSPACDIYAFGIALYELLSGRPPFSGHIAAIMNDHLQTAPARLTHVPDRFWDLLSSCLAKEPAARPTAAALASALREPDLLALLAPSAPVWMPDRQVPPLSFAQGPRTPPSATQVQPSATQAHVIPLHAAPSFEAGSSAAGSSAVAPTESASSAPAAACSATVIQAPPAVLLERPSAGPFQGPSQEPAAMPFRIAGPPTVPAGPASPAGPRRAARKPAQRKPAQRKPAVLGVAAIVILVLVATGVMALGHYGPFASAAHKSLAGGGGTAGGGVVADPGRKASPGATGPNASPSHSHLRSGKKPTPRKASHSLPPVSASPSRLTRTAGAGGGSGPLVPFGPNLVADGTFSDPTLSAWNYAIFQAVLSPGIGVGGQNAAVLTATPEAGIAETISGMPSGHYVLTGWVKAVTSPVYIGARDNASGTEVDVSSVSASFKRLSVDFTVPAGQSSAVIFCVQRRGGTGYCSNFAVHALRRS